MARNESLLDVLAWKRRERCHLCGGGICREHYGVHVGTGWEIDHDTPRAAGGDDDLDNLEPAHISCNRSKQDLPSDVFRAAIGRDAAPMSLDELVERQRDRKVGGALLGGVAGAALDKQNPVRGALWGSLIGTLLGAVSGPDYDDDV